MNKSSIACIIVSFNIGEKIYKCYDSIKNQVGKVIIVDNGSDKETIQHLNNIKMDKNVEIVFLNKNTGIAKALNVGVESAINSGFDWIMTMDNDSKATKSMVEIMIDTYNNISSVNKNRIVSIAPVYINEGDKYNLKIKEKNYNFVDLVITSGNIVKANIFKKIGFFREDYFIDYVDNEFCLRIMENGGEIIQVENAILEHNLGNEIEKEFFGKKITSTNHSHIRRYYLTRNSLDVMHRYKKLNVRHIKNTKRVLLKFILKIILIEENKMKKIKYMIKGYKDYKKQKFGAIE